jgi:hypothetical protein
LFAVAILASVAATAADRPGSLSGHGDWVVGCDNTRSCTAVSLTSSDLGDDQATMVIRRGGWAQDAPSVSIVLASDSRADIAGIAGVAVTRDGAAPPPGILPLVAGAGALRFARPGIDDRHFIARALEHTEAVLVDADHARRAGTSLQGLRAALARMDALQHRSGGPTALVDPSGRATPPPPPPAPLIRRPAAGAAPPTRPTEAAIQALRLAHGDDCAAPPGRDHIRPTDFVRLDARTTLALIDPVCEGGTYNRLRIALLIDEAGAARRPRIEAPMHAEAPHLLVNPWWDPDARVLGTNGRGRGLGDCGVVQRHVWDGARLRLVEQQEMSACRGAHIFIRTWTARSQGR